MLEETTLSVNDLIKKMSELNEAAEEVLDEIVNLSSYVIAAEDAKDSAEESANKAMLAADKAENIIGNLLINSGSYPVNSIIGNNANDAILDADGNPITGTVYLVCI